MSSDISSEKVREHPERVALRKVEEAIRELPAGRPLDPLVIARKAGVDAGKVEAKLMVLAEMGLGRIVFQILDEKGRAAASYRKQSQIPQVVVNEFGDEIEVTPLNTRLAFTRQDAENGLDGSADSEAEKDSPNHKSAAEFGFLERMRRRFRRLFKRVEDPNYSGLKKEVAQLTDPQMKKQARVAVNHLYNRYRTFEIIATVLRIYLALFVVALSGVGFLDMIGLIEVRRATLNLMFSNLTWPLIVLLGVQAQLPKKGISNINTGDLGMG